MPRGPRHKSESGIYHFILKGIDGRNIFLDEGGRKKFLSQMLQVYEKGGFTILAYSLMDNHVHLLLGEDEELGITMKRITVGTERRDELIQDVYYQSERTSMRRAARVLGVSKGVFEKAL